MRRPIVWIAVAYLLGILVWFALHPLGKEYQTVDCTVHLQGTVQQVELKNNKAAILISQVSCQEQPCSRVLVYGDSTMTNLKPGNVILVQGNMVSFSLPGNPGQFNEYLYYKQNKIDYRVFADSYQLIRNETNELQDKILILRQKLCQQVQEALPEREAGILNAMLFGDKSGLSEEVRNQYQQNGVAHLLAISGLHISILGVGAFDLLRKRVCKMRTAAGITIGLLIVYGILTGFSLSTSRAVLMMLCMLTARLVGRAYDGPNAMAISALVTLIPSPLSLFSMSFLFSYGNALAIYMLTPILERWVDKERKVLRAFCFSVTIFIVNVPLCLYFYGQVITYSPIINFVILPVLSILVATGLSASFFSILLPIGKTAIFGMVFWIFRYYDAVMNVMSHFPEHILLIGCLPMWRMLTYYAVMFVMLLKKKVILVIVLVGLVLWPLPHQAVEITFLDVGQGDGIFVEMEGTNMIIDGGSSSETKVGKYRIIPYLQWRGVRTINKMFLTHGDSDHINGLEELLQDGENYGIHIQEVVLAKPWTREEDPLKKIKSICRQKNIPIMYMTAGEQLRFGKGVITCLHPSAESTVTSENNNSLVLRLDYGRFQALFTGDLEMEAEEEMLPYLTQVEVLKVAHHGSKGASSEQMLTKLKPEIAVISAGEKNRYGHPHEETLERLKNVGARIYSTIQSGALTVKSDGEQYWIEGYRNSECVEG